MARDETFSIFVFITLLLDLACSLHLSRESATILPGKTLAVSCRDKGGLPVTWKGPKGALGVYTRPKVMDSSIGKLLIFNNTKIEDTGNYTCSLGTIPEERKLFSLRVEEPIEFMDTREVQSGKEGETVTLRCEVSGRTKVNWLIEDGLITDPKYEVIGDGLVIKNISREDANKVYICQAVQSNIGEVKNCRIKLKVEHKPYPVYEEDNEIYAVMDARVNLTCEVEAEPAPRFDWFVYNNHNRPKRIKDYFLVSSHLSAVEIIMTERTPVKFQCSASNKHGTMEKLFNLHLGTPPEPPIDIKLVSATSNSLELNVELPDVSKQDIESGMQPNFLFVQYKPEDSEIWSNQEFNITEETFLLTNLDSKTKYEVQAATRNVASLSSYTNSTIFETSSALGVRKNLLVIITNIILVHLSITFTSKYTNA